MEWRHIMIYGYKVTNCEVKHYLVLIKGGKGKWSITALVVTLNYTLVTVMLNFLTWWSLFSPDGQCSQSQSLPEWMCLFPSSLCQEGIKYKPFDERNLNYFHLHVGHSARAQRTQTTWPLGQTWPKDLDTYEEAKRGMSICQSYQKEGDFE